jgi:hypothetical protein
LSQPQASDAPLELHDFDVHDAIACDATVVVMRHC